MISTVLRLLNDILSLKIDVNVPTKEISKKTYEKNVFCVVILKVISKKTRIRILSRIRKPLYGPKEPDPYQIVTDPEHSDEI
jgi:hypothetical protein